MQRTPSYRRYSPAVSGDIRARSIEWGSNQPPEGDASDPEDSNRTVTGYADETPPPQYHALDHEEHYAREVREAQLRRARAYTPYVGYNEDEEEEDPPSDDDRAPGNETFKRPVYLSPNDWMRDGARASPPQRTLSIEDEAFTVDPAEARLRRQKHARSINASQSPHVPTKRTAYAPFGKFYSLSVR